MTTSSIPNVFEIVGTWELVVWRRFDSSGNMSFPFGESPHGMLLYNKDGSMAVQMYASERAKLDTNDPIGGTDKERAGAYSSCLAYVGTYSIDDGVVTHHVRSSLFPNWSGTSQRRPFTLKQGELRLQVYEGERLSNEIVWNRFRGTEGQQHND